MTSSLEIIFDPIRRPSIEECIQALDVLKPSETKYAFPSLLMYWYETDLDHQIFINRIIKEGYVDLNIPTRALHIPHPTSNPFLRAIFYGYPKLIQVMLQYGNVDTSVQGSYKDKLTTPLEYAKQLQQEYPQRQEMYMMIIMLLQNNKLFTTLVHGKVLHIDLLRELSTYFIK